MKQVFWRRGRGLPAGLLGLALAGVWGGAAADSTPPALTISGSNVTLSLGGTAADDVGATQVSWSNDRGGAGVAKGTSSWRISGVPLKSGVNVITVTARDAAGNASTGTVTVTYTPPAPGNTDTVPPAVSFTAPTSGGSYTTPDTTVNLSGTAIDNVGVTQVTWSNDRGGSGVANATTSNGRTNWSVSGLGLLGGTNVITVAARDAAGNTGTATLTVTSAPPSAGGTYYVAKNGNDAADCSQAAPCLTIRRGLSRLSSGDTLIIGDGEYSGRENFINHRLTAIPSGTAGKYTTIRAANPFKVRIKGAGALGYYDELVRVEGSYTKVDGLILELRDAMYPPTVATIGGSYNKLMRTIIKRGETLEQYGGWLYVGGSYHLIEDVAGVGAARYGFATGGPDDNSHHIIFRRVVGRFDYSPSTQPKATFNAYGTDSGWGVHHVTFQNCIALDGQRGPSNDEHYGAWYFPKNLDGGSIVGSIALNNAVAYAGMFVQELQGRNTAVQNSVVWSTAGDTGIRWNGTGSMLIDRVTVGANKTAIANWNSSLVTPVRNSLFANNGALRQSGTTDEAFDHNAFLPVSQATGSNIVTATGPLKYLPDATIGTGLTGVGATIRNRIGVSGTVWGEPGFDQQTSESLWPWPYEAEIKAVFAEPTTPAPGNAPSTNNAARGFAAPGVDQWGQPITLTRYIWQYLGNQIPAGIYK